MLCQFAEQAAKRPSEPHVLLVDELNRGNLPRIFGELLYLLEYRDQAVTLPYSKRPFRLPENLFLLATMNQLDRSAVALDQALRRRFSFVDMPSDAAVLASWLEAHTPADATDATFGPRVVHLFEELNRRLARDLGPEKQVGHSLFMVPDLDGEKLAAVWDHHVRPVLLDYLGGREVRLRDYTPERLLGERGEKNAQGEAGDRPHVLTASRPMNEFPIMRPVAHRSRKRRFARWLLVTLATSFGIVWAGNLVNREIDKLRERRAFAAAVEQTNAVDPDWEWDRLTEKRTRPPAGKNGAELIPRIKKLSHADWGKWQAKDEWKSRLDVQPNIRFSPLLLAEADRDLAASADAVALARTLKDYPSGHREIVLSPDVLNTLLEDTQHTRQATDLLRWDVVAAAEAGDTPRAAAGLLAMLNASRSVGDEPFLISQLVRMATRNVMVRSTEQLLAQRADAPGLSELQAALATDAEEPLLLYGVRGERAMFDRLLDNLETGAATPGKTFDREFDSFWGRVGWWHYRPNLRATARSF